MLYPRFGEMPYETACVFEYCLDTEKAAKQSEEMLAVVQQKKEEALRKLYPELRGR